MKGFEIKLRHHDTQYAMSAQSHRCNRGVIATSLNGIAQAATDGRATVRLLSAEGAPTIRVTMGHLAPMQANSALSAEQPKGEGRAD
jgi:hypothetical protein